MQAEWRLLNPYLWRNNRGSFQDVTGRWVRYGLANDSKKLDEVFKSSDLIGITPVTIGVEHVGMKLGVFTAVEVKAPGARTDPGRLEAQMNFLRLVTKLGGLGIISSSGAKCDQFWPSPSVVNHAC